MAKKTLVKGLWLKSEGFKDIEKRRLAECAEKVHLRIQNLKKLGRN